MISARAVAIQGLGYGALLTAVQGLLPLAVVVPSGGGFRPSREPVRIETRSRRRDDDEEIWLIILAALHVLNN